MKNLFLILFRAKSFTLLTVFAFAISPFIGNGQSLQLTGSIQWVNIGDLDISGNQITVEALINKQGGVNVVSKHTDPGNVNYLLRPTTFEITTGSTFHLMNNPYALQNNTWYHIAGTYDGSNIRYYVNGCLVIQEAATGNMAQQNLATAIGNISSSPYSEQFIGMIDEVRIWNIARTQAQLAANMNDLPNPATYPNLRGYYKFNGNLLNSGNSGANNGTGVGAISYGAEASIINQLSIDSVVATNSSCYNANNGSVIIYANGSGVQYSINGTTYQAANIFSNLTPGNYTAYIRSAEGCILSQAFSITQPAQLISHTSATICSGDSILFGGDYHNASAIYTYVYTGSTGCDSNAVLNLTVTPSSGPPPAASLFNTANNGAGGTLPGGSIETTWQVATSNINGPYNPAIVMTNTGSYYSSPWPDCNWISHSSSGNHSGNVEYFYRAQFSLPCFSNCGQSYADDGVFCLNLDFFADNSVYEIYVNGVPQSPNIPGMPVANPYTNVGFNQAGMVSVSLCNDWQPGLNSLIIEVRSGAPQAGFLAQSSINPPAPPSDTLAAQICSGQSYTFGGSSYNSTGFYPHTFQTINGCDSIVTLNLLVKPTPAQPSITSNSPVCEGAILQVNTSAVANASYAWTGPSSWTSSAQNNSLTNATTAMTGTYSLTVTVNGCPSASASANLTVNALPAAPNINITSPVCEGTSIFFSGPSGANFQYHWSGPNAWTATTQTGQIDHVTPNQSGNYSLYVVQNGCSSLTTTKPVTVSPKPSVTYNGPLSFCGTETQLSASGNIAAPGSINSYIWYAQGNNTPIGAGQTMDNNFTGVNPTAPQTISVVANSDGNCTDTATVTITLYATPNADFEWEDQCDGENISFNGNSNWNGNPGAGANTVYGWNFGDTQTGSGSSIIHAYADSGSYTVTLIVGSTESTCSDTISQQIIVYSEPQIALNIMAPICGQTVTFDADVSPSSAIETVDWNLGDGTSENDTAFTHAYQQAGNYTILFTLNTDYNCTFTATGDVTFQPSPSINTVELPNIITPNGDAVNDVLDLDNLFDECVEYELKIMNRWGNLIYSQSKGSAPFEGKGMFGSHVTPGVYFYVIKSGTDEKTGTITVVY